MANTYSQLNIHCVFAVKQRNKISFNSYKNELFQYISGVLKKIEAYPLAVGGWKDHVHILFELNPDSKISEIMKIVKSNSSKWINSQNFMNERFEWQEGYGAFSCSKSQRNKIIKYIINQEDHHKTKPFKDEYLRLLKTNGIKYDPNYIFDFWNEDD